MNSVDTGSLLEGVTVLVVDDDPYSRELLTLTILTYGGMPIACGSVTVALAVLVQEPLQAIISDIAMPQEDGYALIETIRSLPLEQGRHIPAIAFTAMARQEDRQRALDSGFDRYLTKPKDFAELVPVLVELLQERAL